MAFAIGDRVFHKNREEFGVVTIPNFGSGVFVTMVRFDDWDEESAVTSEMLIKIKSKNHEDALVNEYGLGD